MKRFFVVITPLVLLSSLHASLQPQGTVHVYKENGLKIVCKPAQQNPTRSEVDAYLTRKKNIANIVLNGLANACANLVNIIASDSQRDKQQAMLGVIGTVCNVTAELTEKENNTSQAQRSIKVKSLAHSFASLTTALLLAHEQDASTRKPLPQTIALLKNIPEENRAGVIEIILSSSKHAYEFLYELFSLAQEYLSSCIDIVVNVLSDGIDDINVDTTPALLEFN